MIARGHGSRFAFMVLVLCLTAQQLFAGGSVTNANFGELQNALLGGGNVLFATGGSITFTSTVTIVTNTVIDGQSRAVTFDGNDKFRLFNVSSGATLTLRNLTLTRGAYTGTNGVKGADGKGKPSEGVDGKPGSAGENAVGGAIYNAGMLIAENCSFVTNNATGGDGGDGGNGGDGTLAGGNGGDAGDAGTASGGAIYNLGSLVISNCFFSDNEANGGFGGTGGTNGAGTFVSHRGNGGKGGLAWGGGIYNTGSVSVFKTTFAFNVATAGNSSDGGASDNSAVGLDGRNGPEARGGAIQNDGTLVIVNSTFANGDAVAGNGGNGGPGTFTGGDGGDGGDAMGGNLCNNGTAAITNATFAGGGVTGGASGAGGAGGFSGADGYQRGGNVANFGTLRVINTILADPFRGKNAYGSLTDQGHNLSSDDTPNFKSAGSLKKTDPKLGELAANGGYASTYSLLSNSPAIDAGDPAVELETDQRGAPRPAGGAIDIGAFEFGQARFSISGRLLEGTNPLSGFEVTIEGDFTTTDTSGAFVFADLFPGDYTVSPSDDGVGFAPPARVITLEDRSVTNVNFTANPSKIEAGTVSTNQQFQFTVTGLTQRNYVIEASTNLSSWSPVFTNVTDDFGEFDFSDSVTNSPQRFYRTRPR